MLRTLLVISSAALLAGCSTLSGAKEKPSPDIVCDSVQTPIEATLKPFTFFQLPAGTLAPGGVELRSGLTTDGMVAVLDNLALLQKREQQWRGRSTAVNNCIKTEAEQRVKRNKKNGR